jgi:hypothetical protein
MATHSPQFRVALFLDSNGKLFLSNQNPLETTSQDVVFNSARYGRYFINSGHFIRRFRLFGDRTMTNEPVAARQSLRLRYTEAACLKD